MNFVYEGFACTEANEEVVVFSLSAAGTKEG